MIKPKELDTFMKKNLKPDSPIEGWMCGVTESASVRIHRYIENIAD